KDGRLSRLPMALSLILFLIRVFNSFFKEDTKRRIRVSTSSFGLLQFSVEKVYKVKFSIPKDPQASTIFFTVLAPCSWPKTLSFPFCLAQRPLPSIIIAICFGKLSLLIISSFIIDQSKTAITRFLSECI